MSSRGLWFGVAGTALAVAASLVSRRKRQVIAPPSRLGAQDRALVGAIAAIVDAQLDWSHAATRAPTGRAFQRTARRLHRRATRLARLPARMGGYPGSYAAQVRNELDEAALQNPADPAPLRLVLFQQASLQRLDELVPLAWHPSVRSLFARTRMHVRDGLHDGLHLLHDDRTAQQAADDATMATIR